MYLRVCVLFCRKHLWPCSWCQMWKRSLCIEWRGCIHSCPTACKHNQRSRHPKCRPDHWHEQSYRQDSWQLSGSGWSYRVFVWPGSTGSRRACLWARYIISIMCSEFLKQPNCLSQWRLEEFQTITLTKITPNPNPKLISSRSQPFWSNNL